MADCNADPRHRANCAMARPAAISNVDCSSQLAANETTARAASSRAICAGSQYMAVTSLLDASIDELANLLDFLARDVLVLQQMGHQARHAAAEHALEHVACGTLFELVFSHQRMEDERALPRFVRHGAFFLQAAQQGLHGAVGDWLSLVDRLGNFAGRRPPALPQDLHDDELHSAKSGRCHGYLFPERHVVYLGKSTNLNNRRQANSFVATRIPP